MIRQLSILILCAWSAGGTTFPAATTSQADVQAAVNLANAAGPSSSVTIPAGTSTYNSPVTVANGVHIIGAGTNLTFLNNNQVRSGGQEQPIFQVGGLSSDARVEIEGIYFKSLIPITDCTAILAYPNTPHLSQIVVHDCGFELFHFAVMMFCCDGVVYNCTFLNNFIVSRVPGFLNSGQLGGISPPPYPWDTTHTFVFENDHIVLSSWVNDTYISDTQYPANYTYRYCKFDINLNAVVGVDGHDMHNWDNPATELFPLGIQIYSNVWNVTGNTTVNPMNLGGIRGGQGSLVYSNVVIGIGGTIKYSCNVFNLPLTTNNYAWENYGGASGTTPMALIGLDGTALNVNYFNNKPALFLQLQYPHPLRNTSRVGRVTNLHVKNAHNGP